MSNEIKIGDTVLYVDTETRHDGKRITAVKVTKYGTWDGEKVVLNDNEKTTVRNKKWLTVTTEYKYQPTLVLLNELVILCPILVLETSDEKLISVIKKIGEIKSIILSRTEKNKNNLDINTNLVYIRNLIMFNFKF